MPHRCQNAVDVPGMYGKPQKNNPGVQENVPKKCGISGGFAGCTQTIWWGNVLNHTSQGHVLHLHMLSYFFSDVPHIPETCIKFPHRGVIFYFGHLATNLFVHILQMQTFCI